MYWKFSILCMLLYVGSLQAQTNQLDVKNTLNNQNNYQIDITLTPLRNSKIYLGSYYGKYKNVIDSAWLNEKSSGVFKGNRQLTPGIYFIVSPDKKILFEILIDSAQHFSVVADTVTNQPSVKGSEENELFFAYTQFLEQHVPKLMALQQQLSSAKTHEDSLRIQKKLKDINAQLVQYREHIIQTKPHSLLSLFFIAMKKPEPPQNINGEQAFYFIKEHYWDGVPFYDDRLLHTPFFDAKLEEYFQHYVSPHPDSVIAEVNYMLLSARSGKEMFPYLLGKFTDKYIHPEIMGQDKVFLFLFEHFYAKGDTLWLNSKQKEFIFNRAYSIMANQIGEPAPPLNLKDSLGKSVALYNVQAPFTFIVFWDPNCSHCKQELPLLDSFYNAKWKQLGVKIYAVNVAENALDEWKQFIQTHHLSNDWKHVYQPRQERLQEEASGKANFRQLYDVFQTPTMYLLDSSKHILAKQLSLEQFDELLQTKIKNNTAANSKGN